MKRVIIALLSMTVLLSLLPSCGRAKGSFIDYAMIKDAQRTMIKLSNLMEQYYVEHDQYPADETVFEQELRPYFASSNINNESVDKWDEMVTNVFADKKMHYVVSNPKVTYFVYGRAKDSNKTYVFCRPSVQHVDSTQIAPEEPVKKGKKK